jgi:hypothetical protein
MLGRVAFHTHARTRVAQLRPVPSRPVPSRFALVEDMLGSIEVDCVLWLT